MLGGLVRARVDSPQVVAAHADDPDAFPAGREPPRVRVDRRDDLPGLRVQPGDRALAVSRPDGARSDRDHRLATALPAPSVRLIRQSYGTRHPAAVGVDARDARVAAARALIGVSDPQCSGSRRGVPGWRLVSNVSTTRLVLGSMREIALSSVFRTQTAPSPTAMLLGAVRDLVNEPTLSALRPMAATRSRPAAQWRRQSSAPRSRRRSWPLARAPPRRGWRGGAA